MSQAILPECTLLRLQREFPRAWTLLAHSGNADDRSLADWAEEKGRDLHELLFDLNEQEGLLPFFLPTLSLEQRIRLTRGHWVEDPVQTRAFLTRLATIPPEALRHLDTRPILARGVDPFQEIEAGLADLPDSGGLLLLVPFEPLPLYRALAARGFDHHVRLGGDGWEVLVINGETPCGEPVSLLDVRGLPPPEPMFRILAATTRLLPGQTLEVIHDRIPSLLYPRLAERGLTVETREKGETIHLTIGRPPAG